MRLSTVTAVSVLLMIMGWVLPAQARSHHHYRHHYRHYAHHHENHGIFRCSGCVLRQTLAGVVSVSAQNADRFVGLINDLVHAGFKGPLHCAAPYGTHVAHSRHYSGNACDFAQYGWGKTTSRVMYTQVAAAIIRKWGFTNGCSFRDCGHVGTDGQGYAIASRHYHRHYARRYYYHHHTRYAAG